MTGNTHAQAVKLLAHFTLTLDDGTVADSTWERGKPVIFQLGDGSLSSDLEHQLRKLKVGEKSSFSLPPEAVFGKVNTDLIQHFLRRDFLHFGEPELGAIMLFKGMNGSEVPGVVREIVGDSVTVDFNHPLAGQKVHFDIELLAVH